MKFDLAKLHVVTDFDATLTKARVYGEAVGSTISLIRKGPYLPEEYRAKTQDLFVTYHPYENNLDLPLETRIEKMNEWWSAHLSLLVEYGLTKDMIVDAMTSGNIELRDGAKEFLAYTHEHNVPVLILSAGFGDIIAEYLKHEGVFYDNIHLVANMFEYDESGKMTGFDPNVIHSLNKSEEHMPLKFKEYVSGRLQCLLLGDKDGDSHMAKNAYKVCFVNEESHEKLAEHFDLLIEDETFHQVNNLLRQ